MTFVDKSLARGLAARTLEEILKEAEANEKELLRMFNAAWAAERAGKAQAKVVNRLTRDLEKFFRRDSVWGMVFHDTRRRARYLFITPQLLEDGLRITLAYGDLVVSEPVPLPLQTSAIETSRHALERLHQRMNTADPVTVLDEIQCAALPALKLQQAAEKSGTRFWPLVGQRGMFIATAGNPAPASKLITWLPFERISAKWQRVVDDLEHTETFRSFFLDGIKDCAAVLQRHAWLSEPYEPGVDLEAEYWTLPRG